MRRAGALCVLLAALCGPALAQTVGLAGVLGKRALLMVDGGAPRSVGVGESHQGVRLLSVQGEQAEVEVAGRRLTVRLGASPASVGARGPGAAGRIVITSDGRGHFISEGRFNGQLMQFMVDTGATMLAIGAPTADRMGLAYKNGAPVRVSTANGAAEGWAIKLATVRVGEVELTGLDAVVVPMAMPYVLLGNNFLAQFQMTRTSDQMVLERRY
jgi:aspartyl protease family protein